MDLLPIFIIAVAFVALCYVAAYAAKLMLMSALNKYPDADGSQRKEPDDFCDVKLGGPEQ